MTDLDPTTVGPVPADPTDAAAPGGPIEPPASPYEPAAEAAPAAQVQGPVSATQRRPVRWPVAIALIALVLAVSAFVGMLVTGRAPNAKVLGYVPDGTIAYGEARLDLPGDQRLALASFLSKFPGFADQSAIESKLNELLDRFVGAVSNGEQAYTSDISPWFDGELAFALGPLPDPASLSSGDASSASQARFLVLVSIKDGPGVTAWFKDLAGNDGVTLTDQAYDGANLSLISGGGDAQGAFAVLDGKVAVVGDVTSVKAAVDTGGQSPFATQPNPKAALEATDSSHLGFMYIDLNTLLPWTQRLNQALMPSLAPGLGTSALPGITPAWVGLALRAENDAMVLESVAPQTAVIPSTAQNRTSTVAQHVPASAIAALVADDYGDGLKSWLDAYRSDPSLKASMDQIDGALGVLGGVDATIGWIGDTAFVVNESDGSLEAGVVILPTDQTAAGRLLTALRSFIALGGGQVGISLHDESYAGATITTVDLGDLDTLLQGAGVTPGMLGPGITLPSGRVELSYAATDQVVVLGSGPAFVKHVLDTTPAESLASNDRYKALVNRAGQGTGTTFVDIAAIRTMLEGALTTLDPSAAAAYSTDVGPFLAPFDALVTSGSVANGLSSGKIIITVK